MKGNDFLAFVLIFSTSSAGMPHFSLDSEVEARFKEENADGRGCSLTHADEFGQCANIDEEIRMLSSCLLTLESGFSDPEPRPE